MFLFCSKRKIFVMKKLNLNAKFYYYYFNFAFIFGKGYLNFAEIRD